MRFGFYLDVHVLCKKMDSFECYRSYLSYFYKLSTSQGLPIVPKPIFFFGLAAGPTYQPPVRHSNPDTPLTLPYSSSFEAGINVSALYLYIAVTRTCRAERK